MARRRLRFRLERVATSCALGILRRLPEGLSLAAGKGLGRLAGLCLSTRSSIVRKNVTAAMPGLPPERVAAVLSGVFVNLGWTLAEFARMGDWDDRSWSERIAVEGREHLEAAMAAGHGAIFLSAHFGNWELLGGAIRRELPGRPGVVVARPLKNPLVDDLVNRMRTATGVEVVPHRGAFLRILAALRAGGGVGILLDQHTAPHEAVLCRFFGRPAGTNYGLALLAMKSGAPVVPVFMVRVGPNRHRMVLGEPLSLEDPGREGRDAAVREFTQRCTDVIEAMIRQHPDQWFWVHRRWKAETHLDQYRGPAA